MSFEWNDRRVDTLTSLWAVGGYSAREISERLGCTKNAAIGKLHRLGLSRQPMKARADKKKRAHHRPIEPLEKAIEPIAVTELMVEDENRDDLIDLMELTSTTCRWPIGDPVRFCGHRIQSGSVYCQAHHKRAYAPNSRTRSYQNYAAKRKGST